MTLLSAAVLIVLGLFVLGVLWAQNEYDQVKAKQTWPDDWHRKIQ
jgi:hypothetical protein